MTLCMNTFWTIYLFTCLLWLAYRTVEAYGFERKQSRPYFVGHLITEFVLAPISIALELAPGGTLRQRISAAYRSARAEQRRFESTGRKKLIG
jgi:uncharacterized membrane protein YGL010W